MDETWNLDEDFKEAMERLLSAPELFHWVNFFGKEVLCPYCGYLLLSDRDEEFKEGDAYYIEYLPWRKRKPIPDGTRFKKFIRDGVIVLLPDLPEYTEGLEPVKDK